MADLGDPPVLGRGVRANVVGACLVTATALVNPYLVLIQQYREFSGGLVATVERVAPLVVGVGLAILVSLLALRLAPRIGWVILLVGATLLGMVMVLLFLERTIEADPDWIVPFVGAATPVLLTLGLLGAGNSLMGATGVGDGAPVIAAPFVAPFVAGPILYLLVSARSTLQTPSVVLGLVSLAGAVGLVALVPALRRAATPEPLTWRATVVGVLAGCLILLPELLQVTDWGGDPGRTGMSTEQALAVGGTGVLIFLGALGLAAVLGVRPVVAALGIGLILFGATAVANLFSADLLLPIGASTALRSTSDLVAVLVGAGLGAVAAYSRWLRWCAGAACALAATVAVAMSIIGGSGLSRAGDRLPGPLSFLMVAVVVFALVTAVAEAAASVRAGTLVPVVLGLCAVAVLTGLRGASSVSRHRAIAGLGAETWFALMAAGAGGALLLGGLLVLALRRLDATSDQRVSEAKV